MNWELVLQLIVVAVALTVCGIVIYCTWDVAQKNRHERNLELRRFEHEAEDRRAERADRFRPGSMRVEPGAIRVGTATLPESDVANAAAERLMRDGERA